MISEPRWATTDGKVAHLLTDSYYVGANQDRERGTWCGQRLPSRDLSQDEVLMRCGSCLAKMESFYRKAAAPVPDRVLETVTVTVERPVSKRVGALVKPEDAAIDLVRNALGRRKHWKITAIDVAPLVGVDVAPTPDVL